MRTTHPAPRNLQRAILPKHRESQGEQRNAGEEQAPRAQGDPTWLLCGMAAVLLSVTLAQHVLPVAPKRSWQPTLSRCDAV